MSANFLNTKGFGAGCDAHTFITIVEGVPVPVPMVPHFVTSAHGGPSRSWRIAHSVTTDGAPVLQSNWAMLLVPHFPLAPNQHPAAEPAMLAIIVAASSSQPQMSVNSVSAESVSLLTAIYSSVGANVDCTDMMVPGGKFNIIGGMIDINMNTVETSPTLGDYVAAFFSALMNIVFSWILGADLGWLLGKYKGPVPDWLKQLIAKWGKDVIQSLLNIPIAILQNLLDLIGPSGLGGPVAAAIGWLASQLQKFFDEDVQPLLA